MGEWFRKMLESVVPLLVEEWTARKVLYLLFWVTTVFISWGFIVTNPIFGWFVALAPVLLVWQTSRRGLGGVNGLVLGVAVFFALVPAFFLGMAQKTGEGASGMVLVALVAFVVWVAAFPTMLDQVDKRFRRRSLGIGPSEPLDPDPRAEYRVLLIRLWMATIVMMLLEESLVAVICVLALGYRAKWTATIAGVACLVLPLFSPELGKIVWDGDLLDVLAAVLSAAGWVNAIRNPAWGGGLFWRLAQARRHAWR